MRHNDADRRCIFVLGMHRSGTSALTGLLQLLGVDLGSDIMAPRADNEKGFFENNKVVKLNEGILAALGSDWDDLRPLPAGWWEREEIRAFEDEIAGVIAGEFDGAGLFAIKDPRLCRLMPIWTRVLGRLGLSLASIIMVRHPEEVSLSLAKRDGFSRNKSAILWAQHMLGAERHSRDHPRVFVDFAQVFDDPGRAVRRIEERLGLVFPIECNTVKGDIERFLDPGLRHHWVARADPEALPPIIAELYEQCLDFCLDRGDADRYFSAARRIEERYEHVLDDEVVLEILQDIEQKLSLKSAALADAVQQIQELTKMVGEKDRQLNDLLNSRSWRSTAFIRKFAGILHRLRG